MGEGMTAPGLLPIKLIVNDADEPIVATAKVNTPPIDGEMLSALLRVAAFHARRVARTLSLSSTDREDVEQGIVLTVLERAHYFDSGRGPWGAFVDLVCRQSAQVTADALVAAHRRRGPPLDAMADQPEGMEAAAVSQTVGVDEATALRLVLDRFLAELPEELAVVARLAFAEEGDFASAQRRSGISPREFARRLREVRLRLMSLGIIRRSARPLGTNREDDRY
jgi:DNA-directed RNA polymerase specialized sigma24 family protein